MKRTQKYCSSGLLSQETRNNIKRDKLRKSRILILFFASAITYSLIIRIQDYVRFYLESYTQILLMYITTHEAEHQNCLYNK